MEKVSSWDLDPRIWGVHVLQWVDWSVFCLPGVELGGSPFVFSRTHSNGSGFGAVRPNPLLMATSHPARDLDKLEIGRGFGDRQVLLSSVAISEGVSCRVSRWVSPCNTKGCGFFTPGLLLLGATHPAGQ